MEKQTPQPENALRDTDPTVVMDIAVGKGLKKGEVVNFDYDAFRKTNQKLGGVDDNSNLMISIGDPNLNDDVPAPALLIDGKHIKREQKLRKHLQHELQHHIDFSRDPSAAHQSVAYKIGSKLAQPGNALGITLNTTAGILSLPGLAAALKISMDHAPIHEVIQPSNVLPTLGAIAILSATNFYRHNKYERRARKAERARLKPIITVSKMS